MTGRPDPPRGGKAASVVSSALSIAPSRGRPFRHPVVHADLDVQRSFNHGADRAKRYQTELLRQPKRTGAIGVVVRKLGGGSLNEADRVIVVSSALGRRDPGVCPPASGTNGHSSAEGVPIVWPAPDPQRQGRWTPLAVPAAPTG